MDEIKNERNNNVMILTYPIWYICNTKRMLYKNWTIIFSIREIKKQKVTIFHVIFQSFNEIIINKYPINYQFIVINEINHRKKLVKCNLIKLDVTHLAC